MLYKGSKMDRLIKWRLGNKDAKNLTWEQIEKKKYDNSISVKQVVPVPPLDQIHIPAARYWVAKTSFVITNKLAYEIERMPGVSQFRPLEPYSFFIAVNDDFYDEYKVMESINKKLQAKPPKV